MINQGGLESVKAVSDIFAPATGKITAVNDALKQEPAIINKSPEKDGWIAQMTVEKPGDIGIDEQVICLESLLAEDAYKKYCEEHKDDH